MSLEALSGSWPELPSLPSLAKWTDWRSWRRPLKSEQLAIGGFVLGGALAVASPVASLKSVGYMLVGAFLDEVLELALVDKKPEEEGK